MERANVHALTYSQSPAPACMRDTLEEDPAFARDVGCPRPLPLALDPAFFFFDSGRSTCSPDNARGRFDGDEGGLGCALSLPTGLAGIPLVDLPFSFRGGGGCCTSAYEINYKRRKNKQNE
jgi:hypothetical protein